MSAARHAHAAYWQAQGLDPVQITEQWEGCGHHEAWEAAAAAAAEEATADLRALLSEILDDFRDPEQDFPARVAIVSNERYERWWTLGKIEAL